MAGVVVAGMHRSGTSAMARLLNLLGLATCVDADLLGADEFNTRGHWESATVTSCNDLLLWTRGAAWWVPPPDRSWLDAWSTPLVGAAAEAFRAVHAEDPWVLKDPRLSLALPFWQQSIEIRGLVVCCRHPSAVARSLNRRDTLAPQYALALWERYMRSVLEAAVGLPTFVSFYDDMLDSPTDWIESAQDFLTATGLEVEEGATPEATNFLTDEMRHFASEPSVPMSRSQSELWELCLGLQGSHRRLPAITLPHETVETERQFLRARKRLSPPDYGDRATQAFLRFREAVDRLKPLTAVH